LQYIQSNSITGFDDFLNYFKKNYLNDIFPETRANLNGFGVGFWNVFDRVNEGLPRTSNGAESWNIRLNQAVMGANPNIAHFITTLLLEEEKDIYNLKRCCKGIFDVKKIMKRKFILKLLFIITNI
jgi:hypothetical protein